MGEQVFADIAEPPKKLASSSSHRNLNTMDQLRQGDKNAPLMRILQLIHRLVVFGIAVWYVVVSLRSFSTAIVILRGAVSKDLPVQTHTADLMPGYAGTTTIEESPLVRQVLLKSTSLRNDTLYLETPWVQSSVGCTKVPKFNANIYSNGYLRLMFSKIQEHASYNLSYVTELELIAPVVDCTFDLIAWGDTTAARVYYLTRRKDDPADLILLSTSLSAQDYEIDLHFQKGPALVLLIAAIEDMSTTTVDHHIAVAFNYPYVTEPAFEYSELNGIDVDSYWRVTTLTNKRSLDPAKEVRVGRRFGRYITDLTAQSNMEVSHLGLPTDPASELGEWRWRSRAVLHDSWAWTHAIHGVYALNVIFNLAVLTFVIYRRLRKGHLWVGDAFSTISNMLLYRGILILVSNHLNGYWTITKMCISLGDSIAGLHVIYYKPELVHADLLSVFMNLASALTYLGHERVDPVVAFATFELSWTYRLTLAKLFPSLKQTIENFGIADATLGLLDVSPGLAHLSPMELMTAYKVVMDRKPVVLSAVISIFSPIVLIAAYVMLRKAVRHIDFSEGGHVRFSRTRSKVYSKGAQQTGLTTFETATGSALSKRFGIVSGCENYVVRDGQISATIDAVYGNGFLVANGKFLVGTKDLLTIMLMKVTQVRFSNIFVYEITNGKVMETAQLLYPSTISWSDLINLDVTPIA